VSDSKLPCIANDDVGNPAKESAETEPHLAWYGVGSENETADEPVKSRVFDPFA